MGRCRAAALACTLGALCGPAAAQQWAVQATAQARVEANDNPALVAAPAAATTSAYLSGSVLAARSTENGESRVEGELIVSPIEARGDQGADQGANRRANGRLSLRHTLTAPRDTWAGSLSLRRENTLSRPSSAADVLAGEASRSTLETGLSWSHALTERLGTELVAAGTRARFGAGAGAGSDFRQWSLSAASNFRARETTLLGFALSRTEIRQPAGDIGTRIDGFRLSATESLSERSTLSLVAGRSASTLQASVSRRVCPLPVQFCQAGVVPSIEVQTVQRARSSDAQYSAALDSRVSETLSLNASASRALAPSGLGVRRDDAFSLAASRAFSETLSTSLSFSESRSRAAGTGANTGTAARLRTLSLMASKQLAPDLSLSGYFRRQHFNAQATAVSNSISITLSYQGASLLP